MNQRVIELSEDLWVELATSLKPEERWIEDDGLVLYMIDPTNHEYSRKLIFTMKKCDA